MSDRRKDLAAIGAEVDEVTDGTERASGPDGGGVGSTRLVPPWTARAAVVIGLVVIVVLAAGAALLNHRERQVDERTREAQADVAASLTRLLSWDAEGLDAEVEEEASLLTEDFADEYRQLVRENVAPAAEKAGLNAQASVVAQGVIKASADRVQFLYFVNVAMSQGDADPSNQVDPTKGTVGSRIKVTAERTDGRWLISSYDPI